MSNTNVTPRFRRMAAILLAAVMLLSAVAVLVFLRRQMKRIPTRPIRRRIPIRFRRRSRKTPSWGCGSASTVRLIRWRCRCAHGARPIPPHSSPCISGTGITRLPRQGEPIATAFLDPLTDNGMAELTFDAQPAGEYYILVSQTRGQVGVWAVEGNSMTHGLVYVGGSEEKMDLCLSVRFTSKPATFFTALENEEKETDAPSQQTGVPEDSLFRRECSHAGHMGVYRRTGAQVADFCGCRSRARRQDAGVVLLDMARGVGSAGRNQYDRTAQEVSGCKERL